ncbi:hypothetical protein [Paractinoplanes lichenicola]|uniref:Leucine-rich repeat domain-containing protein n=1 Tax=Paractinoplanes lichenicola TaxID=2802976 RepID=A0ABS1VV72_9ACTN|nr:hypothetical protein [Actinoplanes lichenicola]MBL7258379.1 hypothetical protein [Actinoplanes lichenicola]
MTLKVPAIGDVAVMRLPGGGYGACQVAAAGPILCALAWHSPEPPTLEQLATAGPLRLDHHANPGELALISVVATEPPPPGWQWIGRLPVPGGVPESTDRNSGWWYLAHEVAAQRRWDHELPAEAKQAYARAATRGRVEVDFGDRPQHLLAGRTRLDLTGSGEIDAPADGPVRWAGLDDLPRCTSLVWDGPDRGLGAALAAHPIVDDLTWTDATGEADLSGSGLTSLAINGHVELLRLPRGLTDLHLMAGARIETVDHRGRLTVTVSDAAPLPAGLDQVDELRLSGGGTISAAALPDVESLWLDFNGPPGRLDDAGALGHLPRLSRLMLTDAYGLDADTLPELPALAWLTIHGLRRTTAAALRARYRRTAVRVLIGGAKNDTWLAANLTNPFRDWLDVDVREGKAACKAYASAVRAIDRHDDASLALRTLIDQLNRLDLDTIQREEAGDAFVALAARAGIPPATADTWFDAWRNF